MKKARILVQGEPAGFLIEHKKGRSYEFVYDEDYSGPPVSLIMPTTQRVYSYKKFPPYFDGVLPEGPQLTGLLKNRKVDKDDLFEQLIAVGGDLVGDVTVKQDDDKK